MVDQRSLANRESCCFQTSRSHFNVIGTRCKSDGTSCPVTSGPQSMTRSQDGWEDSQDLLGQVPAYILHGKVNFDQWYKWYILMASRHTSMDSCWTTLKSWSHLQTNAGNDDLSFFCALSSGRQGLSYYWKKIPPTLKLTHWDSRRESRTRPASFRRPMNTENDNHKSTISSKSADNMCERFANLDPVILCIVS